MTHEEKVRHVQAQVASLRGQDVHIAKGGVHHFVPLPGDRRFSGRRVDISALDEVLHVDAAARTCTAEPGATFADVVARTLALGLVPKVVPELEGITVGGAVAGCSVESMSFRYGGFHDGCRAYEVVGGDGRVHRLAPEHDLFHMIHGSYGTLGILTEVTFDLVPAKPFVELTYETRGDVRAFESGFTGHGHDFVDGIVHGPRELVLCYGDFVDGPRSPSRYGPTDTPYYRSTRGRGRDVLTTADYLFRYDAECHWLSRTVAPLEWRPVRRLVGRRILGSTNLITWSGRLEPVTRRVFRRPDVVVDVFIPASRFAEFFDWYARELDYWPLWIVPYRVPSPPYPWLANPPADELMIDCAVYGKRNGDPGVDWSQALEDKTFELGGIKTLISRNHYTRERFWEIYHRPNYEAAKARLDPDGLFKDLYDKFNPA